MGTVEKGQKKIWELAIYRLSSVSSWNSELRLFSELKCHVKQKQILYISDIMEFAQFS